MTEAARPTFAKLYAPMVGVAIAVIAVDQVTKHFATRLDLCGSIPIADRPTVGFCLAHNEGMAFSVGWGSGVLISTIAMVIVTVLFVAARKLPLSYRILMGVIAGGALGNVLDRAFRVNAKGLDGGFMGGAVVDFIYSTFWATFNVADSAVVVGGILLSIMLWRLPEPDDSPVPGDSGSSTTGSIDTDSDGTATLTS